MPYKYDNDMEFLADLPSIYLEDLVNIIIYNDNGIKRFTENLSSNKFYKLNYPNHTKYWKVIAEEIQRFGGDTFMNILRGGKGIYYREIVIDICRKYNIYYNDNMPIEDIENKILLFCAKNTIYPLDNKKFNDLLIVLNIDPKKIFNKDMLIALIQIVLSSRNEKAYKIALLLLNALMNSLGRCESAYLNTNPFIASNIILLNPAIQLFEFLFQNISGPDYHVTVPCILQIATLRKKKLYALDMDENIINLSVEDFTNNTNLRPSINS